MSEELEEFEGVEELPEHDLMSIFDELTFSEKWSKVFRGIKMPKETGEYKFAKLQLIRLSAPVSAIVVPILMFLLIAILNAFAPEPDQTFQVETMEPVPAEELEIPEEPEIKPSATPKQLDATITGAEQGRNEIQVGGGFSGVEGAFFQGSYATRNFLGRGAILQSSLQVGRTSQLIEVEHGVALELTVEHHGDPIAVAVAAADESVANEWEPVIASGLPLDAVAGLEHQPAPSLVAERASANAASENSGHSRRASALQSSKARSVRATTPTSASGSTHIIVPAPPKWPNVAAELARPVQCGALSPRTSTPRPHGHGSNFPTSGTIPASAANWGRMTSS